MKKLDNGGPRQSRWMEIFMKTSDSMKIKN